MGRFSRILAFGLLGLLLLWAVGSVDWRPEVEPGLGALPPAPVSWSFLRVGAATEDITPDRPVALAGFGSRRGAVHAEVRDPTSVRALYLGGEPGEELALLSIDTAVVPPPLAEDVRTALRAEGFADVVLTATHTHNGPGGLWDNVVAEWTGAGPFDAAHAAEVREAAVRAALAARESAVHATLEVGDGEGPRVCRSRVPGRAPDRRLTVAAFRSAHDGTAVARLVVFACHPTVLGADDRRLSAEWPGVTAGALDGTTFVLQGAVGDVTHDVIEGHDGSLEERMVALGEAVAESVRQLPMRRSEPVAQFATVDLVLPAATAETLVPDGIENLTGNLLWFFAPRRSRVSRLRLDSLELFLLPGEPVSPLVARWERDLRATSGASGVRVVGLSDGHLGYFETPEALAAGAGESRQAYFGADAVAVLHEGLIALARLPRR